MYCDDLQRVGKDKPLAYLPLDTIKVYNNEDPKVLEREAIKRGLFTLLLDENKSRIGSGALFIADLSSLNNLLQKNAKVLAESGWPIEAESFIRKTITSTVPIKTELFDIIANAYADYTNPGRTDC